MAGLIPTLNFLSRWVLFLAIAYKTYQTRDKGWALLAAAMFINALDVENYILRPMGVHVIPQAYDVASKIPNFYISVLLLWGTFHLKYGKTDLRQVLYISIVLVASYVWIFLLAVDAFHGNFALKSSFPSLLVGGSLVYFSVVLWNYVIPSRFWDRLFPIGLAVVGLLNLTYPVGRPVQWYSTMAFFLAAVGRLLAAIGALTFIFYPITAPTKPQTVELKSGAYWASSIKEVSKLSSNILHSDLVAVTRLSPGEVERMFTPASMVFWVTKAQEGSIRDNPKVVAIPPTKLGILQDLIIKEVEKGYRVVYVDALEYLSVEVGFQTAMKFLLAVRDFVLSKGGVLVLVANPEAFKEPELHIISREFTDLKEIQKESSEKKTA